MLKDFESSGLRIIMILLLLLLYVISIVTVLQFSCKGAIAEDGKPLDSEVRLLEVWAVGNIVIFPESIAWP